MNFLHAHQSNPVIITYSRPGLQGPVYIVSNLTFPRWQLQRMSQTSDKSEAGDEIFYAMFHNVAPGVYQYKIRIGEDQWVIDESRETTIDEGGNQNNVCRVIKEAPNRMQMAEQAPSIPAATTPESETEDLTMEYEHAIQVLEATSSVDTLDFGSVSGSSIENSIRPDDEPALLSHEAVLAGVGSQFPGQDTDGTVERPLPKATITTTCSGDIPADSTPNTRRFDSVMVWIGRMVDRIQGLAPHRFRNQRG